MKRYRLSAAIAAISLSLVVVGQYIADICTKKKGRGSVELSLVVEEAFALKTESNPTPPPLFLTPINVNLNHIVLWFADSKADDAFIPGGGPVNPFDADRDAGVAVLRTTEPLS